MGGEYEGMGEDGIVTRKGCGSGGGDGRRG